MEKIKKIKQDSGSFRDSSGMVFIRNGFVYRRINRIYKKNYDFLIGSGLYEELIKKEYLIPHEEIKIQREDTDIYKIIKPKRISFISYPYEWTFSELKDAALLTLAIQKLALKFGMSLKDASSFNVQFLHGKPIFIDTLSFEKYKEDKPWVAYGQFCRHFLSPLALMAYQNVRLNRMLRIFLDGIPVDIASRLLPLRSYLNFPVLAHIHLHARSSRFYADKPVEEKRAKFSRFAFQGLIESLERVIGNLQWKPGKTEWADYYSFSNYSPSAFKHKETIFKDFLKIVNVKDMWDIGANTGHFSKIALAFGMEILAFDNDPAAIERLYLDCRNGEKKQILPLLIDITNPSPNIGWESKERLSLIDRGRASLVLVLALIHHLSVGQNIPFENLSGFFQKICNYLIIEFIPKEDSQVRKMLINREDVFLQYTESYFEEIFSGKFILQKKIKIKDSVRTMYLYKNKKHIRRR